MPRPAQSWGCKGRSPLHKKTIISPPSHWEGGRGSILPLRGRGATKQAKGGGGGRQRRQAARRAPVRAGSVSAASGLMQGCRGRSPRRNKVKISPFPLGRGRGSILPLRGRGATKQAKDGVGRRQKRQAAPPGTTAARSTGTARGKPRRVYGSLRRAKAPAPAFWAGAGACMEAVKASYFMVTAPSAIVYTPGQLTRLPQETVRRAVASTVTLLGA